MNEEGKKKNWFVRHKIITGVLVLIVIGSIASTSSGGNKESAKTSSSGQAPVPVQQQVPASSQVATTQQVEAKPVEDKYPHFSDGKHIVGSDIQPGTYRLRAASTGCYYERLSGFGGTFEEILANENASGPAVVTIAATDKGFKSSRCGVWTQDLSAITASQTTFGEGTCIVGTDILPGTYKNTGGKNCYYERLSGFSGTFDDILANENAQGTTIVTIEASDKGFKSHGCGTWNKI